MKAILLAGGKGTRLRPLTIHTPKPIVPIFDRPFLHYQLDLLKQVPEIDEVILSLNYQPRRIEEIFGDGGDTGLGIRYVVEPAPLGTGGAVRYAGESLRESVVVFNGDVLTQVDLGAVIALHRERKAKATIVLTPVDNPTRLRPGRDRRATATSSASSRSRTPTRSPATRSTPASTCSSPTPSTAFPKDTPWSIERSFFPSLIERGETFVAYVDRGYWIDIGTPEKYMQVHRDIMDGRYSAPRRSPIAPRRQAVCVSPEARDRGRRRSSRARASSTRARSSRPARASAPTASSAASATSRSTRSSSARSSGRTRRISQEAVVGGSILGRHCHIGRNARRRRRRRARRQVGGHRLQPALSSVDPDACHASESRHLQGLRRPRHLSRRDQRRRRARDRRGVRRVPEGRSASRSAATCGCRRRRWPRRSSTARRRRAPTSSTTG